MGLDFEVKVYIPWLRPPAFLTLGTFCESPRLKYFFHVLPKTPRFTSELKSNQTHNHTLTASFRILLVYYATVVNRLYYILPLASSHDGVRHLLVNVSRILN